jgi:thiol:disulfide interchange protein DsbA
MRLFKHGLSAVLASLLAMFAAACHADTAPAPAAYALGKDYLQVPDPQKPDNPKRISVEEFFWYGCPHCFHLEPTLAAWVKKKPADVDFIPVPNTLGRPIGELHARAFYVAQALGILDKTHESMFEAAQAQAAVTPEDIRELYVRKAGIKPSDFDGLISSFVVDSNVRRGEQQAITYGVTGTPTIVVGGKYLINARDGADMMKLLDFVVDKVRKERK